MITFLNAYKDAQYGRLKGDKKDVYCKVEFDEGKFYKTDDGYILMANVTKYHGVVRAYKPELPLEPGVCAIPIYSQEYELWEKGKDGKATPRQCKPSLFERNLCAHLDLTLTEGKYYQGTLGFLPDDQLLDLTDDDLLKTIDRNCHLEEVASSGKLPEYQANASYKKNGSYGSYKLSPADKVKWLKKELCDSVQEPGYNEEMSLADLTEQFIAERQENETFLALYFDLLKTIVA
ncbi:MAG: hypothetical protein QNJ41_28430 [Xenococcaceae cyanobacterium MO_188.B32]|nr:hypothetical protein [Xenococcaceae cyanobacterium MO_188.B32]